MLTQIQTLHPRFDYAYELDLLLLPTIAPERTDEVSIKKRKVLAQWLAHYDEILPRMCDMQKVQTIWSLWFWEELWSRDDLKNPCISGMAIYYIAARYDTDILDKKKAVDYYKIAMMHDNVPPAVRFLGILAFSTDGNYRDGALAFFLLASSWYDQRGGACIEMSQEVTRELLDETPYSLSWIESLQARYLSLPLPDKNSTHPLSATAANCHDNLGRWLKQLYLWYIDHVTVGYPDITTGSEIIALGILWAIPKISDEPTLSVTKMHNTWQYRYVYDDIQ